METFSGEHEGDILLCNYVDGHKTGKCTLMNKQQRVLMEGSFENDELNGSTCLYDDMGHKLMEGSMFNGMWDGVVKVFHDGETSRDVEYIRGLPENDVMNFLAELERLKGINQSLEVANHQLAESVNSLTAEYEPMKQQLTNMRASNHDLVNKITDKEIECEAEKSKLLERISSIEADEAVKSQRLIKQIELLKSEHSIEKHVLMDQLSTTEASASQTKQELNKKLSLLEHELSKVTTANIAQSSELMELRKSHEAQISALEKQLQSKQDQNEVDLKSLSDEQELHHETELKKLQTDHNNQIELLTAQCSEKTENLRKEMQSRIDTLTKEKTASESAKSVEIKRLNDQMLNQVSNHSSERQRYLHQISCLELDITRLQQELHTKAQELSKVTHVLADSQSQVSKMIDPMSHLLSLEASACIGFHDLVLLSYTDVHNISIGDFCCPKVRVFELCGMPKLQHVSIGVRSFTKCTWTQGENTAPWQEKTLGRILKEHRSFVLSDLPELESLEIGFQSFADFLYFSVVKCDKMKTLQIGGPVDNDPTHASSNNFHWLHSFVLQDLLSLQSVIISGRASFNRTLFCFLTNLPALQQFVVNSSRSAFFYTKTLIISNCMSVRLVEISGEKAFCEVETVILANLPQLEVLEITGKESMKAANVYNGMLYLTDIPEARTVNFGMNFGPDAPFHVFKCIKRGQNVPDELFSAFQSLILTQGSYKDSLITIVR